MSRTDERIREDLRALTRPVELDGVLERVERRRKTHRTRRRVGRAALAVLVLGGSVTATVALTRAFGHRDVSIPGARPTAVPHGDVGPGDVGCDVSATSVDVDGDGHPDQVTVLSSGISPRGTCASRGAGRNYQ